MPFNPNAREVTTECISAFRYRAQIRPSSVENQDYTFKTPGWPGYFSHHAKNLNGQRTQYEIFDYPGRFKDVQHGQDFARYQAEGHRQDAETAACVSNSPKLWPGKRFTLTGHPSETLNREWQVTGSVLEGKQPQAQHGSSGEGTTLSNHLDVIPADRTWRASPLPKPAVDGPQSAIVTGPAGEEIFCDEHGRVRVRFHWDRYCPGNEDSSCWVRVSQAWAGAGFGNLAIPRVGQEVIVDFLNGDPDQPIIMGRTYHQDNRSPGSLPGTKTQMTIRSKTYKGGGFNELKFDDATGNEQVYIHAQKNMDTEVLNNRTTDVKVDHTETIGNNQSITVGLGQTITVGKENASGHDRTVTVAHDQRNTTENDRQVAVGHDDTVTIKNDRKTEVMHDRREQVGNDETLVVGNDRKMSVKGKQEQTTTGDHVSLVKGMKSLEVKGDLAQKISGALGLKVQDDIVLESSSRISLKVGGSFVVIHPGGVDIMGPKINLNSGGSPGTPVGTLQPSVLAALGDDESGRHIAYFPDGTKEEITDQGEPEQYGQTARKVVNSKSEFAINGKEKNYTSEVILITSTIIEKHSTYEIGGDHSAVYFNIKNDSLGPYLFDPNGSYNPYKKLENGHGQRGSGFLFSGEFANLNDFIAYQENPEGESKDKLESEWFPYKVKMVSLPVTDEEIVVLKNAAIALDDGDEEPGAFSCAEWSSKLLQHIEPDMDTYTLPNSLWAAVVEIRKRRLEEKDTAR
ncbi:type VI secretion system tip protein TssI/VgrG, partial [Citrobacter freundii]|uniref:type VI secretion system tip protein TssI/VgrG n=1 Tax=Citrobacter freundii TaxID=546 RepID=UPI003142CAE5